MSEYRRYKPPHLTVKLEKREGEEALPLFHEVNVKLTPRPRVMHFVLPSAGGTLTCDYDPAPLIGEIIHFFAWLLCPPVTVIPEYMEKLGCVERGARLYLEELFCDRIQMCVGTACNYARSHVERYFLDTLNTLNDDAINHTFAIRNGQAFRVEPVEALIDEGLKGHRKRLRESVNLPTRGGKRRYYHDWTDEECMKFARLYEKLLPDFQKAKVACKKDPKNYMDDVDMLFLPKRDVQRLTALDPYESLPSNVALLSAAESLGVEPGLYKPDSLRPYLVRGRRLIKSGAVAPKDFWAIKVWV